MPSAVSRQPSADFPGKLLMFGEHILLLGASALAVPVPAFCGRWAWGEAPAQRNRLFDFAASPELESVDQLDCAAFQADLANGLYFQSNIPSGYGLGSSGALCAAVYDRYAGRKAVELDELKAVFSCMESFFHGNSSGIDPLTSYLAQPVLVQQKHRVSLVNIPVHPRGPVVFLVDTGLPRQTGPMVQWFLAQNNGEVFNKYLTRYLLPAHEKMVSGWINGDLEAFWPALRTVSEIQFHHFTPMVPDSMRDLWAAGLDGRDFVLKICGAGGGGYLLGFAADADTISRLRKTVDIIMPFQTTSGSCDTQSS